jgi:hypothetical protein
VETPCKAKRRADLFLSEQEKPPLLSS